LKRFDLFIDFDGTITENDVGYEFFKRFTHGKAELKVRLYREGKIDAVEVLQHECDLYNESPARESEVDKFIADQKIRPGFSEFVQYSKTANMNITVLSAGFDFYIKPILASHGFGDLKLLATPTRVIDGRLFPEFIHHDKTVCARCANCKGHQISKLLRQGHESIFIGDGHSDYHGALAADIVFARSFLAEMLNCQNRQFYLYDNFCDIINALKNNERFGSSA